MDRLRILCRAHNGLHAEEVFGKEHVARAIELRRRKSERDRAASGLVNMGFAPRDVRRVLDQILDQHPEGGPPPPIVDVVRSAIGLLT